jgi:hypothetical protein
VVWNLRSQLIQKLDKRKKDGTASGDADEDIPANKRQGTKASTSSPTTTCTGNKYICSLLCLLLPTFICLWPQEYIPLLSRLPHSDFSLSPLLFHHLPSPHLKEAYSGPHFSLRVVGAFSPSSDQNTRYYLLTAVRSI